MECGRLTKLIKNWYVQVQDEALAPARMVDFMRAHLAGCPTCALDPVVEAEVKKIIEIVLPPAKIAKPVRREDDEDSDDEDLPATDDEELEEDELAVDEVDDEEEELEDEDEDF